MGGRTRVFCEHICIYVAMYVVSVLLYGCNTWTVTKRMKKKLDRNTQKYYVLFWKQHPHKRVTVQPFTTDQTIQVR